MGRKARKIVVLKTLVLIIKGVTEDDFENFFWAYHGLKSAGAALNDKIVAGEIIDMIIGP